jgi:hypothetical protein
MQLIDVDPQPFGHVPWPAAAAEVPGQFLNVHERVLILKAAR